MIVYNGYGYTIQIDDERGALLSLRRGSKEFVCEAAFLPLFAIRLRGEKGEITLLDAYDADSCRTLREGNTYSLEFDGFSKVDIKVTVKVIFEKKIDWRIAVTNRSDLCIEWVDFPQIAVPNDLKGAGGSSEIFWGFNEGVVVSNIEQRESSWFPYDEPEYPSKGTAGVFPGAIEMPFMAYYGEKGGLYFAAHDRDGNVKGINFRPQGEGIKLEYRLFTGLDAGQDFCMDYGMVMEFFDGDWYAAADIYRSWFEEKLTKDFLKISDNPLIPEWYGQSPVIVTYPVRGLHDTDEMNPNKLFPYIAAMPHIERIAERLDSRIMVILMHWEGTAPWAPPFVWPPYGGEEALSEYVNALHRQGHLIGLYCSGLGWTYQSKLIKEYDKSKQFAEEGLSDYMCLSPSGELPFCNICPAQRIGYDMCPTQDYTVNVISDAVEKMTSADVDYIQLLDQNHGGTSYFCYSREHGHPAVPGRWQTDAMKRLLNAVGQYTHENGRRILLGCESAAAEPFIPYLLFSDNRYELGFFIGRSVPAYAYVYHEYVNNFMGNQVCAGEIFDHAASPENLLYRIAYAFCAGDMMTLVIDENGQITWNWGEKEMSDLPEQEPVLTLVRNLNAWRRDLGKEFLHLGRMSAPFALELPAPLDLKLKNGYSLLCEQLLTTRWQSPEGKSGQIIVNYQKEPVNCTVNMQDVKSYTVYEDPEGISVVKGTASGEGNCRASLTVQPLSAVLVTTE